jgi:hypothetical protein
MNIDPMGVVGHGLSTTAHAWKTLIPRQPACCPHHGDSSPAQFDQTYPGGEMKSMFYLGDLRGLSLPHHGATAMASTVANAWKMPVL